MYRQRLYMFDYKSHNQQLIEEFETMMIEELKPFVKIPTQLTKIIPVTDSDIRSVLNVGINIREKDGKVRRLPQGKYNRLLKSFRNTISMKASNNSPYKDAHQDSIFSVMIDESNSFQGLMNKVKEYLRALAVNSFQWNKVWYGDYQDRGRAISNAT